MNGVNEVQSSSMVQQRNGLNAFTSSPIAQSSSMDQENFVTIMEDNNGEQASAVTTTSSSLMVQQCIPNRVLTELSVKITNTPTTININKRAMENPLSESGISSDEVGETIFLSVKHLFNFAFSSRFHQNVK